MSIHVLADNSGKLAGIRAALEHKYDVTSELLGGVSISRSECTALVIKADLRIVENIAALRKTLGNLSRVRRRIFLFDQTVHWWIAQAYAFGAGKAIISTPYWHAQELLADGRGALFPFADSAALSQTIISLMTTPPAMRAVTARPVRPRR